MSDLTRAAQRLLEALDTTPLLKAGDGMLQEQAEPTQDMKAAAEFFSLNPSAALLAFVWWTKGRKQAQPDSVPVKRSRMEALSKALGHPIQLAAKDGDTVDDALISLAASRLQQPKQEPEQMFMCGGTVVRLSPEQAAVLEQAVQETGEPIEERHEFTDSARAALLWVLWHHQGGNSPVGQPLRFALGMGAHDRLSDHQIDEAKRWAARRGNHEHQADQ
jgi:hypothetical protein